MSFRPATKDLHQTTQLTSLYLIGGYDANPNISTSTLHVDLRVAGGAFIKKNLIIGGNIYTPSVSSNTITGDIVTSSISEATLGGEIAVNGNLHLSSGYWLKANTGCINNILAETIIEKFPSQGINVTGNVVFGEQITVVTMNADNIVSPLIECVTNITSKSSLTITAPNSLQIITPTIDIQKANITNVHKIIAGAACPIDISMDPTQFLEISSGSGINMLGKDIVNANVITTTTLQNEGNNTLTVTSNTNVCVYAGINIKLISNEDVIIDPINGATIVNSDLIVVGNMISFQGKDVRLASNLDMTCHDINNVNIIRANVLQNKSPNHGVEITGAGNVVPLAGHPASLGLKTNEWRSLFVHNANVSNTLTSNVFVNYGDAIIGGKLTVLGNLISVNILNSNVNMNRLTINANVAIAGLDTGLCFDRFQNDNDVGYGDLSNDIPNETGVVVTATATDITLQPSSSGTTDYYEKWYVKITSGMGIDQIRRIKSYDGLTKIADLDSPWTIIPGTGNSYELFACKFVIFFWDAGERRMKLACTANCSSNPVNNNGFIDFAVADLETDTITPRGNLTSSLGDAFHIWNKMQVKDICLYGNIESLGPNAAHGTLSIHNINVNGGNITNVKYLCTSFICGNSPVTFIDPPLIGYNDPAHNQFWGFLSGQTITSAVDNTAVGYEALQNISSGRNNVAVGTRSLHSTTTGSYSVGVGAGALINATSASHSVAIGANALSSVTTGSQNVAVGRRAASKLLGNKVIAIGADAFGNVTSSTIQESIAIGTKAGDQMSGSFCIAIGGDTLSAGPSTGSHNITMGYQTAKVATSATNVTAIGHKSLVTLTTGSGHVAVGYQSGNTVTTGIDNVLIGRNTNVNAGGVSNAIAIGASAVATGNRNVQLGANDALPTTGELQFRTQTISKESWIDATTKLATIDATGNFVKGTTGITVTIGGSIDMQCYDISNVGNLSVSNIYAKDTDVSIRSETFYDYQNAYQNQFWGYLSGQSIVSAGSVARTTSMGQESLRNISTGVNNTAFGAFALHNATICHNNTAIGSNVLHTTLTGNCNVGIGVSVLEKNTTGSRNIGIGDNAAQLATTSNDTIAIGFYALSDNQASENVAIGNNALRFNVLGTRNVGVGHKALYENDTAIENTGVGWHTLQNNMTGNANAAFGKSALSALEHGYDNVAIGADSMSSLILGNNNVSVGAATGFGLTHGDNCVLIGTGADTDNDTFPNDRIAIGHLAIAVTDRDVQLGSHSGSGSGRLQFRKQTVAKESWIDGFNELAFIDTFGNISKGGATIVSLSASLDMQSGNIINISDIWVDDIHSKSGSSTSSIRLLNEPIIAYDASSKNQFWGYNSGRVVTSATQCTSIGSNTLVKLTTGVDNTAGGYNALNKVVAGAYNTAFGRSSLEALTSGTNNTAVGRLANWKATLANRNTAIGSSALQNNLIGNDTTAIGYQSLLSTTADFNTAVGSKSGSSVTSGSKNVLLGNDAGIAGLYSHVSAIALTTGSKNTVIGSSADVNGATVSNSVTIGCGSLVGSSGVAFGYSAAATGSGSVAIGAGSISSAMGAIAIGQSATASSTGDVQLNTSSVSGAAKLKFRTQVVSRESWIDGQTQFAIIDGTGNLTKTPSGGAIDIVGNIDMNGYIISNTSQLIVDCIDALTDRITFNNTTALYRVSSVTTSTSPALLLLDSATKPVVPIGARWCGSIDLIGGTVSGSNMYCEKQSFSAINIGGTVTTVILTSDFHGTGTLDGSVLTISGNATSHLNITITPATSSQTEWVASLLITELII